MTNVTRLGVVLCTFVGITLIAFFTIRIAPGDPVLLMVGERGAAPEQYRAMETQLGLDKPIWAQYGAFLTRAVRGDLGTSIVSGRPVSEELLARWPASIELGAAAMLIALAVGIPIGVVTAIRRDGLLDHLLTTVSLVGYSMPIFWLGLLLILLFSVYLGVTPVSGRLDVQYDVAPVTGFMCIDTLLRASTKQYGLDAFGNALWHLCLPALTMAVALAYGCITHQVRNDMTGLRDAVDELRELCGRYGFAYYREWALVLDGWSRTDGSGTGLAQRGIDNLKSEGAFARMPYWLSLLADLAVRDDSPDTARATLDAAIAAAHAHDDVWWLPEVMRMRAAHDDGGAAIVRLRSAAQVASAHGSVALLRRCEHDLQGRGVRLSAPGVLPTA